MLAAWPTQIVLTSGLDELHGVVDRQARAHRAAGRVDVERDVLLRVLGLQEQQLRDHEVRHVVLDRAHDEDHALLEQARIDVVGTLAAGRLFDDHRDEIQGARDLVGGPDDDDT